MARLNRDRHVWGETNPIYVAVKSGETVFTGDQVYMGAGIDLEAFNHTDMAGSADDFCGVAMQYSLSADPTTVRVATTGVFEFDCAADTFVAGETVTGAVGNDAQKVVGTDGLAVDAAGIGRAWKAYTSNTTKVLVKIDTSVKLPHQV